MGGAYYSVSIIVGGAGMAAGGQALDIRNFKLDISYIEPPPNAPTNIPTNAPTNAPTLPPPTPAPTPPPPTPQPTTPPTQKPTNDPTDCRFFSTGKCCSGRDACFQTGIFGSAFVVGTGSC